MSDETVYINPYSFDLSNKARIDKLLADNDSLIRSTPNLIIDITSCSGGSDRSFAEFLPYMYTNTFRIQSVKFLATENNARQFEDYARQFEEEGYDNTSLLEMASCMRANPGEFIPLGEDGRFTLDYGTSRSNRIPDFCIDDIGIQPDFLLDDAMPYMSDKMDYVLRILENR